MLRRDLLDLARLLLATAALALAGWLGLVSAARGAPVPKQAAVRELTPEMVEGTWLYEWHGMKDGVICFEKSATGERTYVARHDPNAETFYVGTWHVEGGDTVVISERSVNPTWGYTGGPTTYRFKFAVGAYPVLKGTSTSARGTETTVTIWNRK